MRWDEVTATYPNQWLVIEALEVHVECVEIRFADGTGVGAAPVEAAPVELVHDDGWNLTPEPEHVDDELPTRRVFDRVHVLELCPDGRAAMHASREHVRTRPGRDVCCVHTSYPSLQFETPLIRKRRSFARASR